MFSQFLIYINVPVLICLDPKGNNVCSKFFYREINSKTVNDFIWQCCPDFYQKNNTCQPCPAGTHGIECEEKCPLNYYGFQCKEMCKCSYGYMCSAVQGCIRNNIRNYTDHTEYRILNSENITWVPHIESRSVLFQIFPVLCLCATLITWLVVCVLDMKTNLCPKKLNKRCTWQSPHHNKREKLSQSDSMQQNVTKKAVFNTQQHITKIDNNPYCEPWEVTNIV